MMKEFETDTVRSNRAIMLTVDLEKRRSKVSSFHDRLGSQCWCAVGTVGSCGQL